jgi:2'-5' RNA ligase
VKELAKSINEKLNSQDKNFESHITLARVKFLKNKKEFIEKLKNIKVEAIEMTIDSFSLKKSTLTEKGPLYETIKEFKF